MPTTMSRLPQIAPMLALSTSLWANAALASDVSAETEKQHARPHASQLIRLPRPMRMMRAYPELFAITDEQARRLETELHDVYSPQMHALMQQASQLEDFIRTAILIEERSLIDLADEIDRLIELQKQMLQLRVAAIARLRAILSPEQFSRMVATHAEQHAAKQEPCQRKEPQ